MALEFKLIKPFIVEAAKFRGQPTERPDKSELPDDNVNDEAEPRFLDKRQSVLGFRLHLGQRIARCQKV